MKYRVVLTRTDEGYSVSCPGLPGCWSQGTSKSEALENIRDAIIGYRAAVAATLTGANAREIEVTDSLRRGAQPQARAIHRADPAAK